MKLLARATISSKQKELLLESYRMDYNVIALRCGDEFFTLTTDVDDDFAWELFKNTVAELADCDAEDFGAAISRCERVSAS